MTIQKVNTSRNTATRSTYVGEKGRLFYDEANGTLYISDGQTPGGSSIFNKLVNGNYSATLDSSGNLTVPGNLTVQGTTTTVVNETVTNSETITGTLTVSGFSTLANATLTGSGQNLFLYSNVINSTNWGTFNCTLTAGQTDPFGGTAATLINDGVAATTLHCPYQGGFILSGNVTFSVYAKAGTLGYLALYTQCGTGLAFFNLTNGTYLGGNAPTTSITSAGNGWYRCSMTFTGNGSSGGMYIMTANGTSTTNYNYTGNNGTLYIAFPQVSISSGPITYLGTTTSAITGNPQLSFNGNASLQMDASGNLLVAPGGSGAVQLGNTAGNYIQISNAASGTSPVISVVGVDAYPSLYLLAKSAPLILGTRPGTSGSFQILDIGQAPVNIMRVSGSIAGVSPSMSVSGTDSNIDLTLTPKGTGNLVSTTELLKGTGQNLLTQSSTFTNATAWNPASATITGGQTDPFGGTNASLFLATAQYGWLRELQYNLVNGVTYTLSLWCYVASGTRLYNVVDYNSNILGSFTATTTWTRYSVTFTAVASVQLVVMQDRAASGFINGYIYGAQLEIGFVANTYIPTTTTAVYGTPTLSFSGVAGLGLQSDGSLYVSPAGTGALQAQATTSSAVGGNARGANAVDWQTLRSTATQVASGGYSTVAGGQANLASASGAFVGGGYNNLAAGTWSSVVGGYQNSITLANSSPAPSVIAGGQGNTANGFFNFIGGGYLNSGTSNSTVTTQASTIAVTANTTLYLTATNANIKAGQLVQGTGVANQTFATSTVTTGTPAVMNTSTISGTTLTVGSLASGTIIAGMVLTGTGVTAGTYIVSGSGSSWVVSTSQTVTSTTITGTAYTFTISQNATTAAGVTLSFYTPHGVVVGGGNNQATGSYSFIGGGGDAGTAANRNIASGAWSTVVGGIKNTASGPASFIGGGGLYDAQLTPAPNSTSGASSVIVGGSGNTVISSYGMILGGRGNYVDGTMAAVIGGAYGSTRGITGYTVFPGNYAALGNYGVTAVQAALLVIAKQTTDATPTVLTSDGGAPATSNQVYLQSNSAYYFAGSVIAGVTGGGNTKAWTFDGAIKKGAANSIALVGTPTITSSYADAGASSWTIAITVNTTLDALTVTVTGQAATTIRWVCKIETTEMNF